MKGLFLHFCLFCPTAPKTFILTWDFILKSQGMKKIKILVFALMASGASAQCLVSSYYFNGDASDSQGAANSSIVVGATLTSDRFGNSNSAYEFDGINDYIDTRTTFDYQFKSISFWAYPHSLSGGNTAVCQDADNTKLTYGMTAATFKDDSVLNVNAGGASSVTQVSSDIQANQWYHVVLIRNGNNDLECYVNGVKKTLNPATSGNIGSGSSPYEFLVIGANRKLTTNNFDGVIDDVLIYNCAIDSATVDSLYNFHPSDTLNSDSCLVAYYPFNNGSVADVMGNSNATTIMGAVPTSNRLGVANSAYYFDGFNDYISTNTSYDYNYRTVAFWVRPDDLSSTGTIICQDSYTLNNGIVSAKVQNGTDLVGSVATNATVLTTSADTGVWYHVALVRDASTSSFYLNGRLVASSVTSNNNGSTYQANEDFLMGVNRKLNTNFFEGALDEVRIYKCALDSAAIAQLADSSATFKHELVLKETQNIPVSIYPNPATNRIQIEWSGVESDMQIQLYNLSGQLMGDELLKADQSKAEMFVSDLERGIYIFRIFNANGQLVKTGKLLLN